MIKVLHYFLVSYSLFFLIIYFYNSNILEFNKTIPPLLNVLDLALNISIIIMGIIYRNDCPYHYVFEDSSSKPLFKINLRLILIVFGVFILIIYNLDFVFG